MFHNQFLPSQAFLVSITSDTCWTNQSIECIHKIPFMLNQAMPTQRIQNTAELRHKIHAKLYISHEMRRNSFSKNL
jgi:hypothetical protein